MVRLKRRVTPLDSHPDWAMRFKPAEWPGTPADGMRAWRIALRDYWSKQLSAGAELPVAARGSREDHVFWLLERMGDARRLVRGGEDSSPGGHTGHN